MVNKIFIMMPVMFAARKLDAEDPMQVFWLRIAYGTIQTLCVLIVAYTYIAATSIAGKSEGGVIYVPPAPQVRVVWIDDEDDREPLVERKLILTTCFVPFFLRASHLSLTCLHPSSPTF